MDIKHHLLDTTPTWGAPALRLALGTILFAHGSRSMLGWFGGHGLGATMDALHAGYGLPHAVGFTVIAIQFFGSLMLLAGAATRLAALGVAGIFLGMILTAHLDHGFFMNWYGTAEGEGYEYHLLVLGMAAALLLVGGGRLSVDRLLSGRSER